MKAIQWEQCTVKGAAASYQPTSENKLNFPEHVEIGMIVTAKYQNVTVGLEILADIGTGRYSARVKFFEPSRLRPTDLSLEDMVSIPLDMICWIHKKE